MVNGLERMRIGMLAVAEYQQNMERNNGQKDQRQMYDMEYMQLRMQHRIKWNGHSSYTYMQWLL